MALHAVVVNLNTIDFVEQHNAGVRPDTSALEEACYFIYGDGLNDPPNEMLSYDDFVKRFDWHACNEPNCNIVYAR